MAEISALPAAVGGLAVALEVVFAWPQASKALRAPDVAGISAVTAVLMVLTATSWLAYGIAVSDPVVIVANLVMAIATLVIAGALVARGRLGAPLALGSSAAWAAVAVGALALFGPAGLGAVGATIGISMGLPQAARAVRTGSVAGVAISSYVLLGCLQASWLVYGLLIADAVIVVPNIIALPITIAVTTVLAVRRAGEPEVSTERTVLLADT